MKDVVDYDRGRRSDAVKYAQSLQIWHGTIGMIKYTCYGSILVYLANMRFPWVQKQTLAGKAFVVSSFSIFGCVLRFSHDTIDNTTRFLTQSCRIR